jgi:O-antigen/teichoic acid export membrane protein
MRRHGKERRYIWLWVGVVLLSISGLLWLLLTIAIVAQSEDANHTILSGLALTIIPTGMGIYSVRRGKGRRKKRVFYG